MRRPVSLIAIALLAATPLIAQSAQDKAPEQPGNMDVSRISGGTYQVDPSHTLVGFEVNHFGFNDYFGIFGDVTGTLDLDPDNANASKVDITIPVAKVTTASAGLTDHLLRAGKDGAEPDFFGPSPTDAKFVSTSVTMDDDEDYEFTLQGNLTLNGITKPVTLDAKFTGAGTNPFNKKETVGFEAETTINRSDFGINYAIPMVSDEVELEISAAFEK